LIISTWLFRKKKCFVRPGLIISNGNCVKLFLSKLIERRLGSVEKNSADLREFDTNEIDWTVFERLRKEFCSIEFNCALSIEIFVNEDKDLKLSDVMFVNVLFESIIDWRFVQFS